MYYVGRLSRKPYARDDADRQRLPQSSQSPDQDGWSAAGWRPLHHSTTVTVAGSSVNPNQGDTMRRLNKMFNTMTAVAPENLPASRGRGDGVDIRETDDYKALAGMPVTGHDSEQEKRSGWSAVDAGSEDKAKKLQAKVNVIAKAGAGTFRTKLPKGSKVLSIKRISAEYTAQRGSASE